MNKDDLKSRQGLECVILRFNISLDQVFGGFASSKPPIRKTRQDDWDDCDESHRGKLYQKCQEKRKMQRRSPSCFS